MRMTMAGAAEGAPSPTRRPQRRDGMAETREERRQREEAARLHALMQAVTRVHRDATPPTLLTVRMPTVPATAPPTRDARRRQPRGAIAPREVAQAQEQALAQARQT